MQTNKICLAQYSKLIGKQIPSLIENFDFSESSGAFDYLTKSSAVFSSNIEGNSINLNSYMNYELNKEKYNVNKEINEIENLIEASIFGQNNELTETNLLYCHKVFSETLLIESKRGKYRTEQVGVFGKSGLDYLAVEPQFLSREMKILFDSISELLDSALTVEEAFYFASMIHLKFAHIHPFRDGNGRAARLLEKWFISVKLGKKFWEIPSEEYYYTNQQKYYDTINLGINYYELNYDKSLGFLEMLPNCLRK